VLFEGEGGLEGFRDARTEMRKIEKLFEGE
jgi:hypothetical protein